MSYYLEVSASEVPPSSVAVAELKHLHQELLLKEDEIRMYLFLKHLYSAFPPDDDITTSDEADQSIWGNSVQFDKNKFTLVLTYSKAETGVAAIISSARKYGLSVFDFQSGRVVRYRRAKLRAEEITLYPVAHKFLFELAEWSKFSRELEKRAWKEDEEERLTKLAATGYGPAKRALSFYYYLNYFRSRDKEVRQLNLKRAYELIKEVSTTAYASRSLLATYKLAAKQEGLIFVD
jgi:hypothetical protein